MHFTLDRLYNGYERHLAAVAATQMAAHIAGDPQRWSVQTIVRHLLLTYSATSDNFLQRLEKGTGTKARPTVEDRVGQFVVCTLGMFPKGRKAPAMAIPSAEATPASGDEMLEQLKIELRRFNKLADDAERMFGSKRAISHPVLGPMSVKNWRLFHLRHGEHHLRQVAAVLAIDTGAPAIRTETHL